MSIVSYYYTNQEFQNLYLAYYQKTIKTCFVLVGKYKTWFCFPCSLDALPRVTCPNHPDAILVEDYRAGDMICPECGLVVGK